MSERIEKAWKEFIRGNMELIPNFEDILAMAFTAGWFAGNEEKKKKVGGEKYGKEKTLESNSFKKK